MKVPKTDNTNHYREPGSLARGSPQFSDFKYTHSNSSNFFIRGSMELILGVLESYTRALFKNTQIKFRADELHRSPPEISLRCEFP